MKLDMQNQWIARIDVTAQWKDGRTYTKHMNVVVFAPTLERAAAVIRADFPDAPIWAINHGHRDAVILAETLPVSV
jgi:hypothetical protein